MQLMSRYSDVSWRIRSHSRPARGVRSAAALRRGDTMMNRIAFALACIYGLAAVGCSPGGSSGTLNDGGTSGPDATTGADNWFDAGRPKQIPASTPGVLVLGPPGLALAIGQKAMLSVKLYDSAGVAQTVGPVTFTSQA